MNTKYHIIECNYWYWRTTSRQLVDFTRNLIQHRPRTPGWNEHEPNAKLPIRMRLFGRDGCEEHLRQIHTVTGMGMLKFLLVWTRDGQPLTVDTKQWSRPAHSSAVVVNNQRPWLASLGRDLRPIRALFLINCSPWAPVVFIVIPGFGTASSTLHWQRSC